MGRTLTLAIADGHSLGACRADANGDAARGCLVVTGASSRAGDREAAS